ncbi:MAG: hypothetical protein JXR91_09045 [Deltaproteobacteria bacterium]|nr:hypothetical protein [Deltaproteobacteria bacterium]
MKKRYINIILLLSILTITQGALAAETRSIKACFKWQGDYTRGETGLDYLLTPPNGDRGWTVSDIPVDFGVYVVINGIRQAQIKNTVKLKSDGCTDFISYEVGKIIFFNVKTTLTKNGRTINILPENTKTWLPTNILDNTTKVGSFFMAIDTSIADVPNGFTLQKLIPASLLSSLIPLVNFALENADDHAWPVTIKDPNDSNKPKATIVNIGYGNFVLATQYYSYASSDIVYTYNNATAKIFLRVKGALFHELGHMMNFLNKSWRGGNYDADSKAAKYLNSPLDLSVNLPVCYDQLKYTMVTREWSGASASEGYAQFNDLSYFIDRSHWDVKTNYNIGTVQDPFSSYYPNAYSTRTPLSLYPSMDTRWTAEMCPPPSTYKNFGSIRDWTRFYWALWAEPNTNLRLDMSEINAIQARITENKNNLDAWCVPFTTNGEEGWTCRNDFFVHYTYNRISYTNVKIIDHPATKYNRGMSWAQFRDSAAYIYLNKTVNPTTYNVKKYNNIIRSAFAAGVRYE